MLTFHSQDSPGRDDREPEPGEKMYAVVFPLDTGEPLQVMLGQVGMDALEELVRQYQTDRFIESVMEG